MASQHQFRTKFIITYSWYRGTPEAEYIIA